jgi:hypothetical protein
MPALLSQQRRVSTNHLNPDTAHDFAEALHEHPAGSRSFRSPDPRFNMIVCPPTAERV